MKKDLVTQLEPSDPYIFASWAVLGFALICYCIGLFNAEMQLNEKGYYVISMLFGLYSSISMQKLTRDREDGLQVNMTFYGITVFALGSALVLFSAGLWNAQLLLSEKGFFAIAYVMAMFASATVQKNIRDKEARKTGKLVPTWQDEEEDNF